MQQKILMVYYMPDPVLGTASVSIHNELMVWQTMLKAGRNLGRDALKWGWGTGFKKQGAGTPDTIWGGGGGGCRRVKEKHSDFKATSSFH